MNALKKLITIFIGIILTITLFSSSVVLIIKNLFEKQLVSNVLKEEIIVSYSKKVTDDEKVEQLENLLEDKELKKLAQTVIDEYIDVMSGDKDKISYETVDKIIDFVVNHKENLEEITGEKVSVEEIKSEKNREKLYENLNNNINQIEEETNELEIAAKAYNIVTSSGALTFVIIVVIVSVGMVILINQSIRTGLTMLGVISIILGINHLSFYVLVESLLSVTKININNRPININVSIILIVGIISLLLGIIMLVSKKFIPKKENGTTQMNSEIKAS